jgi:hypothetical protein
MHTLNPEPSANLLPPGKERIRQVKTFLTPDVRRIKVSLELDPFQKPPNLAGEYALIVTLLSSEIQLEDQPSENLGDDQELHSTQRQVVDTWVEKFIIG